MATVRVPDTHRTYSFSSTHPPALEVDPGDLLIIDTLDARSGTIRSDQDLLDKPHPKGVNPVTGPIAVRSAEPGDALLVRVEKIELASQGFTGVKAGTGLLGTQARRYVTRIVSIREGTALFAKGIEFPCRPMIGTIGVAPTQEISSLYPGTHGGNMDNNEVQVGALLHLPVYVRGALLSVGDVHACMGDGEISMVGLDIPARVTMRIELARGEVIERPWIETSDGRWVTTGDHIDPGTALQIAALEMVRLLMRRLSLSFEDAYMLATVRGDLAICQACEPGKFPMTTRMSIPVINPIVSS